MGGACRWQMVRMWQRQGNNVELRALRSEAPRGFHFVHGAASRRRPRCEDHADSCGGETQAAEEDGDDGCWVRERRGFSYCVFETSLALT